MHGRGANSPARAGRRHERREVRHARRLPRGAIALLVVAGCSSEVGLGSNGLTPHPGAGTGGAGTGGPSPGGSSGLAGANPSGGAAFGGGGATPGGFGGTATGGFGAFPIGGMPSAGFAGLGGGIPGGFGGMPAGAAGVPIGGVGGMPSAGFGNAVTAGVGGMPGGGFGAGGVGGVAGGGFGGGGMPSGGVGASAGFGFIGGAGLPGCDEVPVPPLECRGIRSAMICPTPGLSCNELPCGVADLGRRTCVCSNGTWACSSCSFPTALRWPADAPICSGQADGLLCTAAGQVCKEAPGLEICVCWPDDECTLHWDCDAAPQDSPF